MTGLSGTIDILIYLDKHGQGQYNDFNSQICDKGKKVVEHLKKLIEISAFPEEGGEDE